MKKLFSTFYYVRGDKYLVGPGLFDYTNIQLLDVNETEAEAIAASRVMIVDPGGIPTAKETLRRAADTNIRAIQVLNYDDGSFEERDPYMQATKHLSVQDLRTQIMLLTKDYAENLNELEVILEITNLEGNFEQCVLRRVLFEERCADVPALFLQGGHDEDMEELEAPLWEPTSDDLEAGKPSSDKPRPEKS